MVMVPLVWGWEVAGAAARLYAGLWFRELRSVKVRCDKRMELVYTMTFYFPKCLFIIPGLFHWGVVHIGLSE